MKAATGRERNTEEDKIFQSTPPVKAATPIYVATAVLEDISIHAAREGGDSKQAHRRSISHISIHAAREGGDAMEHRPRYQLSEFQSTPPVKAATAGNLLVTCAASISIHAAREGGDNGGSKFLYTPPVFQSTPPVKAATYQRRNHTHDTTISIHAAREGGDVRVRCTVLSMVYFNPRRP